MNPDEFDFFRHIPKEPANIALDLLRGLEDRSFNHLRRNVRARENREVFAEDQLVRKKCYDEMRCEMPGTPRSTFLMVFSPDGSKVASTHGNHNIYVTDIKSGKNIRTLVGHPRTPWCIAFHPTSNQIIASGCLGGEVRIWDLSGGSEVWTAGNQSVIASIAFHPNDRVLVIATYNELYFWDWSKPEPFVRVATGNPKEKIRYVAFDKLGHKLITGIANTPQTRWERVRAPVPVPRQAERSSSPYRLRITPRLVNAANAELDRREMLREATAGPRTRQETTLFTPQEPPPEPRREYMSSVPERERRITASYRNLLKEYELLVQRYLKVCTPPTMIDRGTDPMETGATSSSSGTQAPEPSSSTAPEPFEPQPSTSGMRSSTQRPQTEANDPQPSTSRAAAVSSSTDDQSQPSTSRQSSFFSSSLMVPSRILNMKRQLVNGTQTVGDSRKHKASEDPPESTQGKRVKCDDGNRSETATQTQSPRRILLIRDQGHSQQPSAVAGTDASPSAPSTSPSTTTTTTDQPLISSGSPQGVRILCPKRTRSASEPQAGEGAGPTISTGELANNIQPIAEEMRNRFLPIIKSLPACDRPKLIRRFENSWARERMKFRNVTPTFVKKPNRRPVLDTSSDSSSSDDDRTTDIQRTTASPAAANRASNSDGASTSTAVHETEPSSSACTAADNIALNFSNRISRYTRLSNALDLPRSLAAPSTSTNSSATNVRRSSLGEPSTSNGGGGTSSTNISGVRNFVMELEQLLMTVLLTEIESGGGGDNNTSNNNNSNAAATEEVNNNSNNTYSFRSPSPNDEQSPEFRTSSPVYMSATNTRDTDIIRPVPSTGRMGFNRTQFRLNPIPRDEPEPEQPGSGGALLLENRLLMGPRTGGFQRRRLNTSFRVSAFMPTRVNYARVPRYRRATSTSRISGLSYLGSEDDTFGGTPPPPQPSAPLAAVAAASPQEVGGSSTTTTTANSSIGNMYTNIVHDLETSLNDVRNLRTSSRPGETSDMLSSFSESLENIMNQSDTILRNLGGSMMMLPNNNNGNSGSHDGAAATSAVPSPPSTTTSSASSPRVSVNDPHFYVRHRDVGTSSSTLNTDYLGEEGAGGGSGGGGGRMPFLFSLPLNGRFVAQPPSTHPSVVESDHSYPRVQGSGGPQGAGGGMSPLMTSLHLTISYIQRQARLLRQQVESIERIDRAMFEVEQLQIIRQLVMESLRFIRAATGESNALFGPHCHRNRTLGMSSVRQMMAGTRISDSSPYDSEEQPSSSSSQMPGPSSEPSTSQPSTSGTTTEQRPRSNGRKTYPPSRLFRSQRHRRSSLINFFPRRYTARPERCTKHIQGRPVPRQPSESANLYTNYSLINSSTLSMMGQRLEHLLTEQTRVFTRRTSTETSSASAGAAAAAGATAASHTRPSSSHLGERILSIRLHDCVLRMNRVMGNTIESSRFRNSVVVTQDGASRYPARHFLSLIVDGISKHLEDLQTSYTVPHNTRGQMNNVLAMALLLCDLLLLELVDSIPPPAGMNLDMERESLTSRIDQMCGQMLQNRFSTHSSQLTRSLHHMRLTMRHAYRALGQTYNARRNAMLPNRESHRRQLLSRYLRNLNRRRQAQEYLTERPSDSLRDLIMRYSDPTGDDEEVAAGAPTGREALGRAAEQASSNNSDDNDDESEWYVNNNNNSSSTGGGSSNNSSATVTRHSTTLYRTNNVNLLNSGGGSTIITHEPQEQSSSTSTSATVGPSLSLQPRPPPWSVPSVQVNDVPISEQSSLFHHQQQQQHQRMMSHRYQRNAERVSELRHNMLHMNVLRPRFLHPLYAGMNPFDADLDDPQREATYDCDMITTMTPNHRIQVWDISSGSIPAINNPLRNIIVSECKIHNDASVDIAKDGTILVTLLPSGGYLNITNKLGVYSLKWDTLGQCLYTTSFEQNAVSVALSPLSRHLVVGLASRRVSIVPSDRWTMARIFIIDQKDVPGDRLPVLRELGQNRDSRANNYKSVNCIRWLPTSGQGLIYATNTGQLVILT